MIGILIALKSHFLLLLLLPIPEISLSPAAASSYSHHCTYDMMNIGY
jgi:hypothetical protein